MSLIGDIIRKILGKEPKETQESIKKALVIATRLREWLKSPTADILIALIPGDWDQVIRAQAVNALDKIIPQLYIGAECGTDIKCWAEKLANAPKATQDMHSVKLAQLMAYGLDPKKFRQNIYDYKVQEEVTVKLMS